MSQLRKEEKNNSLETVPRSHVQAVSRLFVFLHLVSEALRSLIAEESPPHEVVIIFAPDLQHEAGQQSARIGELERDKRPAPIGVKVIPLLRIRWGGGISKSWDLQSKPTKIGALFIHAQSQAIVSTRAIFE